MRWISELDDEELKNYDTVPGPYWVKEGMMSTQYLIQGDGEGAGRERKGRRKKHLLPSTFVLFLSN